jgi:hypothetical protein
MGVVVFSLRSQDRETEARRAGCRSSLGARAAKGEQLAALCGSSLRDEFFSWRGASGRRYVCSVFPRKDFEIVEQFKGVTLVGVAGRGAQRRAVCVLSSNELLSRGHADVDEWHVHFGDDERKRRDLAASLLH